MNVAIGLPSTIPGASGASIVEWASRAEARGFSSLATLDRLVYPGYDPLVALSAAAAVTSRIGLLTSILITPLRTTAVVAKQLASLDRLSEGRLTVGVALGGREDDYLAIGRTTSGRGAVLASQLEEFRRIWAGESPSGCTRGIGPEPWSAGGPPILLGAFTESAIRRGISHAAGWISGGLPPDQFRAVADSIKDGWRSSGREGEPRLLANTYFCLGADARATADAYIHDYYAFLGDQAAWVAAGAATEPVAVQAMVAAYADAGCDEILIHPCSSDPAQVDLLADALGRSGES